MAELPDPIVDPASEASAAVQIRQQYALLIADGRLVAGDRLPAVRDAASRVGVSINTVRAAYARLEADGLVATRHGVGTVVLPVRLAGLAARRGALGPGTIGVVVAGLNPFYLPILGGIVETAHEAGVVTLMATAQDHPDRAALAVRQMAARGVPGFIILSADIDPAPLEVLPVVSFDRPGSPGYGVDLDAEAAGRLLGEHLAAHGHRRVGLVAAPLEWENVAGLPPGLRAGLPAQASLEVAEVPGFSLADGRAGLAALLARGARPSAVVGAGALLCLGILEEAAARGLRVPADLAVVGYADAEVARLAGPSLTMAGFGEREAGRTTARMLLGLLEGKRVRPRRVCLTPELRVRASCGCG